MSSLLIIIAVLAVVILLPITMKQKTLVFWMAFIAVFLPIGYIDRYFVDLPTIIRWIPQLFFIGCAILSIFFYRKTRLRFPPRVLWIFFFFLIASVLSMFYNKTPLVSLIFAQRGFIYIITAIIIMKSVYEKYTLDDIYTFIIKTGLFLAAFAVFQRVVFVTLLRINSGDMITGGFTVDGEYLFYQVICIIIVMAYWFKGKKLIKLSPSTTLLILVGSIAIANNKAGLLFIILVLCILVYQVGIKAFWRQFKVIAYVVVLLFGGIFIFNAIIVENVGSVRKAGSYAYLTDPEYIGNYLFGNDSDDSKFSKGGELRRGSAIEFAYDLIKDDPFHLLLGRGPGSVSESRVGGAEGYLALKYPGYNIERSVISMLLSETGFLGMGLYFLFLMALYFRKTNHTEMRQEHHIIRKTIVIFMLLYAPYHNLVFLLSHAFIIATLLYPNLKLPYKKDLSEKEEKDDWVKGAVVKSY